MTFSDQLSDLSAMDLNHRFESVTEADVQRALERERCTPDDFIALLSPAARPLLEAMAQRARQLTLQHFGHVIQLYIPLYIANHCTNECLYCGFNRRHAIRRTTLTLQEIEHQARQIMSTGMRHILVLTGESRPHTPISYLIESVILLKQYFPSVSIEMFPMETEEYRQLKACGVDGMTLYQEVYDPVIYDQVHLAGRKKDYRFRLDGPERGARAGLRVINIGPLFGLGPVRREAFLAGMHARYLEDHFLSTEINLSMPRLNPAEGNYISTYHLDDTTFVQFLTAFRIFLPRVGIPISTREKPRFRDHLLHLGATRLSAGSVTQVGGYETTRGDAQGRDTPQFDISDQRSVAEVVEAIRLNGLQPVFKDWEPIQ